MSDLQQAFVQDAALPVYCIAASNATWTWATALGLQVLHISQEVQHALRTGQPVVALESTIISHGMPFPQNLEMAQEVEAIVRAHGAVPATIAVIQGTPCVGLSQDELRQLASR